MQNSPKVALLTCTEYPRLTYDDALLLEGLREQAFSVDVVIWDEPKTDWQAYSAVIIRSTWDYFAKIDKFCQWLSELEKSGVKLLNPIPVLRANIDKRYLRLLEKKGVKIVPTTWVERGEKDPLKIILSERLEAELVLKPALSAGGFRTYRLSRESVAREADKIAEILQDSTLMAQPLLQEVLDEGEWSFLYFGGEFSHAVRKRAKSGEFRVQWTHGGSHAKMKPPAQALSDVEKIMLLPEHQGLLYARVDGVIVGGEFQLMELELLEPHLFFAEDPQAVNRYIAALRKFL